MRIPDVDFFERRATQEASLALAAACPQTSAIHRELAQIYRQRLDRLRGEGESRSRGHATG